MLQKPVPDAAGAVDYRLLVPVLINSTLIHTVVSILRVTTSYRAVELDLSIIWLGVISATFAIFPIFLAVSVGRFIDRGHDATTAWIGSGLIAVAAAGFTFFASAEALLAFTAVLGTGHLFMMAAQQMLCVRSGGPAAMDRVFGNYGGGGGGPGPGAVHRRLGRRRRHAAADRPPVRHRTRHRHRDIRDRTDHPAGARAAASRRAGHVMSVKARCASPASAP